MFLRKVAIAMIAVTMSAAVSAQTPTFTQSDNLFSIGLGLGNSVYTGSNYASKFFPVTLYYENCVKGNLFDEKSSLGIGGVFGYTSAKSENTVLGNTYGTKFTNIIIGARGVLHYAFVDKLDTYAGVMVGYNIASGSNYGDWPVGVASSSASSNVIHDIFAGARYYFSDTFAAFSELGYGVSYLNIGVSFKF